MKRSEERKLNRKNDYDYSQEGCYFVTIVTKDRGDWFGDIKNDEMILNRYGEFAREHWLDIPRHFEYAKLDEFIIMPNHIHGVIGIDYVGNADLHSLRENKYDRSKMELSKIIHGFKSSFTRDIRLELDDYEFAWQKSFYDRIIRSEVEYLNIKNYIINNPVNWDADELF